MAKVEIFTKFLCPYCSRAKALLERNNNPTETEVRYWLAGNLCRCTGYEGIVEAIIHTLPRLRRVDKEPPC